ncbi:hypothetical protein E2C01_096151 [Portunus trituberculatus]|uniref:Uncharacterized protein n=1 Tax=Portunus trituberculatus TaxID=210409 RepID=A0A5B7JX87_PORTR|nr:hypothetical protein [Portunus trituberculatus]
MILPTLSFYLSFMPLTLLLTTSLSLSITPHQPVPQLTSPPARGLNERLFVASVEKTK